MLRVLSEYAMVLDAVVGGVIYGEYEVTGRRQYRGHDPGTRFEAKHDPAKDRAIRRGDIRLLRLITPAVPPGATYPKGWLPPPDEVPQHANKEAPETGPQS